MTSQPIDEMIGTVLIFRNQRNRPQQEGASRDGPCPRRPVHIHTTVVMKPM